MAIDTNRLPDDEKPGDGVKRAPAPSVGDLNNPANVAEMYTHIRASHGEKIRLSEQMRKSKVMKSPDSIDEIFYTAPPKRAYPLSPDHPIFLRGAELGIDVLSDRLYKIVLSTYTKGFYTEDEVDCFTTAPSGKPPKLLWDIIDEDRIPEWAKSRFFFPSGKRRKRAAAMLPLPTVSPEESQEGVRPVTPEEAYFGAPEERLVEELLPWDTSSFDSKLFIPGLHGQHKVMRNRYRGLIDSVDATITLGNMLRLAPFLQMGDNSGDEYKNVSPVIENAVLMNEVWARGRLSAVPLLISLGLMRCFT